MSDDVHVTTRESSHLASIFDAFPPGTLLSLGDLELAMCRDIERRSLAALDRAMARLSTSSPTLTLPVSLPPEQPP
jgi:hypothetical protein